MMSLLRSGFPLFEPVFKYTLLFVFAFRLVLVLLLVLLIVFVSADVNVDVDVGTLNELLFCVGVGFMLYLDDCGDKLLPILLFCNVLYMLLLPIFSTLLL